MTKKNRMVNTFIWKDPWFVNLRLTEQHLFLYLLTSPQTDVSGVYEISLREMAFDTTIDQEEIKRIFTQRFQPDNKAYYERGWVVMKNWLRHQSLNPKVIKGVETTLNNLPEWLREAILFDEKNPLYIDFDSLSIAYDILKISKEKRIKVKRREDNLSEDNPRNSDWYKKSAK